MGWPVDAEGLYDLLLQVRDRVPQLPLVHHRERHGGPRLRRPRTARSSTTSGSTTCTVTSTPRRVLSMRALTFAATSAGRSWTTSNGPRATRSGSGWCSSTTARSGASPSRAQPSIRRSHTRTRCLPADSAGVVAYRWTDRWAVRIPAVVGPRAAVADGSRIAEARFVAVAHRRTRVVRCNGVGRWRAALQRGGAIGRGFLRAPG